MFFQWGVFLLLSNIVLLFPDWLVFLAIDSPLHGLGAAATIVRVTVSTAFTLLLHVVFIPQSHSYHWSITGVASGSA